MDFFGEFWNIGFLSGLIVDLECNSDCVRSCIMKIKKYF